MSTTHLPSDLLSGLSPAQLEAVTTPGQPLCILAGAGSGKTRVLTRRIAWRVSEGSALASHVLALTFTRRAADELSSRLAALGVREQVAAGTFHAIAYAQLRRRWADTGQRPPGLLDRKTRVLARLLPARRSPSDPGPSELAGEIEWAQARMVSPAGYADAVAAAGRKPPLPASAVSAIYERYQLEKHRQNLVDFDDLLLACAQVLDGIGGHPLRAPGADGPLPTVTGYASDAEEARHVVRALRRRGGPGRWSDLAVLARTHAQLVVFEDLLKAAGIPYRLRGASAFLDQPAVRDAIAGLRRRPREPLAASLPDLDIAAVEAAEGGERGADLDVLARQAREFLALDPAGSVGGFVAWLTARMAREEPALRGQAVDLATIHAAKGLEWPAVFVVGFEQGLLPIGHATTPEARAEERRLLYVAVTRAERELHFSWAERRTFGSGTMARSPSPWLEAVEDALQSLELAAAPGGDGWRACVDEGRARLRSTAGGRRTPRAGERADPHVLQALRSWRADTARASGVPAFVVFHDTTLAAVAEARPRDRPSLLALPGMGPVKADRYGDALLAVVASSAAVRP